MNVHVARAVRGIIAGLLLMASAPPVESTAVASSTPVPTHAPTPPVRAHAAGSAAWTSAGPYVDDATAVAASPNFDADHTVFTGVSYAINLGQPTIQAVAMVERSTDGGTTWTPVWSNASPQGTTQNTLNQIVVSPQFASDHTVFALWSGPTGGGVLRSTDGGASFSEVLASDKFSATTRTLSISPSFASDGHIAVTADFATSATSFLSRDHGQTWSSIPVSAGSGACTQQGGGFLLVLGGTSLGSYVSNNLTCTNNSDALYAVSSDDGGTWSVRGDLQAPVAGSNNFDTQHSRMVAAGNTILYTDEYGNALRSGDGGATWQNLLGSTLGTDAPPGSASATGPYYTFKFGAGQSVYAVHEWTKLSNPHIYYSANSGQTWSVLWQGGGATAQHDVVQAGAQTIFFAAGNEGIWRSSNLGQTWQSVGEFLGEHNTVAVSPNFATDHAVFTVTFPGGLPVGGQDPSAFGIYRSTDAGATWAEPEAPNPAVGAGFGTVFTTSSQGGSSMVVSPNFANDHTVFEGDRIGAIAISHDGGRTWTSSLPGTPPQEGWFVNAMAISPNYANDHVVYWGGGPGGFGVFKSVDGGQDWFQVTPQDRLNEIAASEVEDLAVSQESSGTLDMAIAMSDKLWLAQDVPSSTARQEWLDAGFATSWAVAMSPHYQSDCTIYAVRWPGPSGVGATLEDGVYVSHNACMPDAQAGAITWTWLTSNLPVRDFDTVALSPNFQADHTLFIGSYSSGVWMSTDGGQSWTAFSDGLGDQTVHKLTVASTGPQSGVLFAATDGGVWQTPVSLTPSPAPPPIMTLAAPQRLVDTRTSSGPIASGQARCFPIAGVGGVPQDASGVLLNVAAVQYPTRGWLTVYPGGHSVPATSTLNFDTGEYAIANGTLVGIGANGQVCVSVGTVDNAPGSSQVVLDATGYVTGVGASLAQLLPVPQRVVDTRTSSGPIGAGTSTCFSIAGVGGIPQDASGVLLNVAAVQYATQGWLTLYPNGQPVPTTSTLNFDPREYAIANGAIVRIGTNGEVCVNVGTVGNVPGSSQVVLDATGYITSDAQTQVSLLTQPQRLVDTRTATGPISSGSSRCFLVANQVGVPANATGVILNVAAVQYMSPGWLTLYPSGQPVPATSSLNFDPSEYAIANGTVARLGPDGQVCVNVGTVNSVPGSTQVVLDVVGYLR